MCTTAKVVVSLTVRARPALVAHLPNPTIFSTTESPVVDFWSIVCGNQLGERSDEVPPQRLQVGAPHGAPAQEVSLRFYEARTSTYVLIM